MSAADCPGFVWPPPPNSHTQPLWTGAGFEYEGQHVSVLSYLPKSGNWSKELTEMHELEAGPGHPINVASRRLAIENLRQYCQTPHPLLLDVGCSSGYLLKDLQTAVPDYQLAGSDFILEPLRALAQRLPMIPFVQFDICECPLPSASLDVVVSLNVLEHIRDDQGALRQLARLLKPGGLAYIEVPSSPACYDIYDEHLMHYRRYRKSDLRRAAEAAGFEVLRATHLGVFIFPAFYAVKRRNRRLLSLPVEQKAVVVAAQIRQTQQSWLMRVLFACELWFGRFISYPFGIRCVLVLRKKSQ